jgi:hypothetical protein
MLVKPPAEKQTIQPYQREREKPPLSFVFSGEYLMTTLSTTTAFAFPPHLIFTTSYSIQIVKKDARTLAVKAFVDEQPYTLDEKPIHCADEVIAHWTQMQEETGIWIQIDPVLAFPPRPVEWELSAGLASHPSFA